MGGWRGFWVNRGGWAGGRGSGVRGQGSIGNFPQFMRRNIAGGWVGGWVHGQVGVGLGEGGMGESLEDAKNQRARS